VKEAVIELVAMSDPALRIELDIQRLGLNACVSHK
jgi:hypothetical protein